MLVDVYSIEPATNPEFWPVILSFDHNFLLNPQNNPCPQVNMGDGVRFFTDLFFPKSIRQIENGLKQITPRTEIGKSLVDKLSESVKLVNAARHPIIDKYGVASEENFYMVETQELVRSMLRFSQHLLEKSSAALLLTHNAHPSHIGSKLTNEKRSGWEGFHSVNILTKDPESGTYTGEVSWSDYIEKAHPVSRFVAHPIPGEVRPGIRLFVRDAEINGLTGSYHFALGTEFNRDIGLYIKKAIDAHESGKAFDY